MAKKIINSSYFTKIINNKSEVIFLLILIFCYLFSRFISINSLPIFTDEAMYLNWGRLIWNDPIHNLFISLTDGQQPFFIWVCSLAYGLGGAHYLLWGRIISVISGMATMLLLYKIGKKIWNKRVGLITAFLYLISPFALWYDRLAIKDTFLLFLAVLLLYCVLGKLSWFRTIGIGFIIGVALLTKSIAYFYVLALVITIIINNINNKTRKIKYIYYLITILFIGIGLSQVMRFSSNYDLISSKNQGFLLTPVQFLQNPFSQIKNNLYQLISWDLSYFGLGVLVLAFLGLVVSFKKNKQPTTILLSWSYLPIIVEVFLATIFFPRYTLMQAIALFLLAGLGLDYLYDICKKYKIYFWLSFVLFVYPNLILTGQILTNTTKAQLPAIERWQYIEGWPSGYGIKEVIDYLNNQSKEKAITVLVEDITLTPATFGLELRNATIKTAIHANQSEFPYENLDKNQENYLVIVNNDMVNNDWPLKLVLQSPRIGNKSWIKVYKITI